MTVPSQGIYYSLLRTQVSDPSVKALGAKLSHSDDALGENKGASKVTWVLTVQGTFDGHGVGAFDRKLHIPSPPRNREFRAVGSFDDEFDGGAGPVPVRVLDGLKGYLKGLDLL